MGAKTSAEKKLFLLRNCYQISQFITKKKQVVELKSRKTDIIFL